MTASALVAYGRALAGEAVSLEYDDGTTGPLSADRWLRPLLPGDRSLLAAVVPPVLDVGCGPGRLAAALLGDGVLALGIDVSRDAVALARATGAAALRRDVFGTVPGEGRWACALLADGNVGIGGDPVALLHRVRRLLTATGIAVVETDAPTATTRQVRARLRDATGASAWFPWAHVSAADLPGLAHRAGMRRTTHWTEADRWYAVLSRR